MSWRTCSGSASTVGSSLELDAAADLLDAHLQVGDHLARGPLQVGGDKRLRLGRDPAEGEQIVDQGLHPPGRVLDPVEVVATNVVERGSALRFAAGR